MIRFLRDHPTWGGAALSLLGAVLGIFLKNPQMVAALVAVAAAFLGIHEQVTPVAKVNQTATQVATEAVTQVVAALGATTVGTVGEVTGAAETIIEGTVGRVVDRLL